MTDTLPEEDNLKTFMDRHDIKMWNTIHDRVAQAIESGGFLVMTVERHPERWRVVLFSDEDVIADRHTLENRIVQLFHTCDLQAARFSLECNQSMAVLRFSLAGGEIHLGVTYYASRNARLQRERWEFHTGP